MPNDDGPKWQADHERATDLADEMELDDDERDSFIDTWMTRKGYKPVKSWSDPEPENDKSKRQGDFFTPRRKERETQSKSREQRRASQYE